MMADTTDNDVIPAQAGIWAGLHNPSGAVCTDPGLRRDDGRRHQASRVHALAAVEIPNGGIHDMVQREPGGLFEGTLHGEDVDTGERWAMAFWLPESAVREWRA